ncbi:Bug family tripartite tricarboxylate transporter substrate binding protein [Hydrogenophaga sp.]|uniref:Bug family tripartite tricarboxylate transporter substrate binding protein n=1 Tax=Hydrogenophaga sp. TaxID=1904254 RepID=UPI00286DC0B9|nr:tripartite tricarboxylate transporter substrate-binding protein [Hydrogenophaga sp.]
MNLTRRHTLAALACTALSALGSTAALAQAAYPAKTVTLVNNFPPGGPSDILARSVAASLQESLKQSFIVENKAGASGNIGAAQVAKSAPDGYTVLFGIDTAFTVNPHLYPSMPFKPGDLKPVVIMASSGLLIGTHPATGIKTFGDLLSKGRQKSLNFSSGGNGSPGHLAAAVLSNSTPVRITHIPYKGNTPAVTAVLSGEVDGGILATPGMLPHVQAGKINPLAVTSARRSQLAPQLPTVAELGLKALELEVLYLVMVPAATPDTVVQTLAKGINEALQRPDMKERMKSLDLFYEGLTGAAASKRLSDMQQRYGAIVQSTGMKAD